MATYSSHELFTRALYNKDTTTIPILLEKYENSLRNENTVKHILHANRIHQYRKEISNPKYYNKLRKNLDSLFSLIQKTFPEVQFVLDGRIKSVVSMDKKIVKNLNSNKSLDLIRDTIGLRIMILNNFSSEKLTKLCYVLANKIISFSTLENCWILCEAEPEIDVLSEEDETPAGIYIPAKSLVNPEYTYGVKDYILHPKKNGYQSLHLIFRLYSGECFEIQIRTFGMHLNAETGNAAHSGYKKKKYVNDYVIDRNQINLQGYGVSPSGQVLDAIGFETGLLVYRRPKVY